MHYIEAYDGYNYDSASDDDDEAFGFSAEVHAEYIRKTFEYYKGILYDKWTMCQTSDNARVGGETGELLKIPYLPLKIIY